MTSSKGSTTGWIADIFEPVIPADGVRQGQGGEVYLPIGSTDFARTVTQLASHQFTLIGLVGIEGFGQGPGTSLLYIFEKLEHILILIADGDGTLPSIAKVFPSASWFERECRDGFGVEFKDAFDTRRLFLHETYPDNFHPLKKSFANAPITPKKDVTPADEYPFRKVSGDGVYQVPVGPVHAGIIEPGHFRFSVIGETIFNLEVRMFYKHRGIEKLAEGKETGQCLAVAEAVSGDESVANTTAFCMAAEQIAGVTVPERAWYIRTILLEMERITSHLGDQGGMLVDVGFPLGANQFSVLREDMMRQNAVFTGSRFLRGMIRIGGVVRDMPNEDLEFLASFLSMFRKRYQVGLKIVLSTTSVIDRFATTGVISRSLIQPLALSGPVARASGSTGDTRIQHPYGLYDRYRPAVRTLHDGDVLARFTVKAAEIVASLDLIEQLIKEMPAGPVVTDVAVRNGHSLALVESARGQNLCWLQVRNGRIERYKVRTASFCNWQAIGHAVLENILPDFPVINKSMNLSYAGTDL
ncbi:MAG: NADH-quinone oxidoreductase subunit C [Methanoregula sp.]|jgi:Ni,Fe-hydrogenase III large subunit/Ni,Fe-hydrogenase III component G|nr:NADH-quinone oxidoreductase subunit C [Methanoregula sp.]